MKLTMVTLSESVQIGGDNRRSWIAGRDEAEMWLDGTVLHIKRRGVHFATTSFIGVWAEEPSDPKAVKKAKAAEAP